MTWKATIVSVLFFFILFISFFLRSYYVQDPDLSWHLKTGEVILERGIPKTDPFSYTMPSYRFVDHEWLSDIAAYTIYNHFGLLPLHYFFALISTAVVFILWKFNKKYLSSLIVFLVAGTLFDFVGIRMQIFTWIFLAILVKVLYNSDLFHKYRYVLPLLFLLWANIHGGFSIGLFILSIWMIGTAIEKKKFDRNDVIILITCFFATLINPYGYYLWIEIAKSLFDPKLHMLISEWYPVVYSVSLTFWIYFIISVVLMARYQSKFTRIEIILYMFVLLSAIASMRNIPVFLIATYAMTIRAIIFLAQEAKGYIHGRERFTKAYYFFCIMSGILCLPQLFIGVIMLPKMQDIPPTKVVTYLKEHIPQGNILTPYGYGGFFILHFPEKKVFIDGRMPSWRNASAPASESTYAMGDFVKILAEKESFDEISKKYGIDTIVVPASDMLPKPKYILGLSTEKYPLLEKIFSNVFTFSFIIPHIRQSGWNESYRDSAYVIFTKQ